MLAPQAYMHACLPAMRALHVALLGVAAGRQDSHD